MKKEVKISSNNSLNDIITNFSDIQQKIKELEKIKIYGIKIDKNNSDPYERIEYTDNAIGMKPAHMDYTKGVFDYGDWKDVWFVKENHPVMLNPDGTVAYRLRASNYLYKEDGTESDIYEPGDLNAMSEIPLVYVSMCQDDNYEYIKVCKYKVDDTYIPIAHMREDGTVVDKCYIAMFNTCIVDGKQRSIFLMNPYNPQTYDYLVETAMANGEGYTPITYGKKLLINILLLLMGKSCNCQEVFGNGNVVRSPLTEENNYGIMEGGALYYHGQFIGYNNTESPVKVFHIEHWWGNIIKTIVGFNIYEGEICVSFTGPYNINSEGYEHTGVKMNYDYAETNRAIFCTGSNVSKYGIIQFLTKTRGTSATYLCDAIWCGTYDNTHIGSINIGEGNAQSGTATGPFSTQLGGSLDVYSLQCGSLSYT